jgi:hypothetical protein
MLSIRGAAFLKKAFFEQRKLKGVNRVARGISA